MYTIWIFLLGVIATIGVYRLRSRIKKWYAWPALAAWLFWTCLGISFVQVNLSGHHVKAATVGAFIFFIISIAAGIYLARRLGWFKASLKISSEVDNKG